MNGMLGLMNLNFAMMQRQRRVGGSSLAKVQDTEIRLWSEEPKGGKIVEEYFCELEVKIRSRMFALSQ